MKKNKRTETRKLPKAGLHFDNPAVIMFTQDDGDKRKAKMQAYSGQPMNHWLFGKVVIDVEGLDFDGKNSFPVLEEHERTRKIGFSDKPETKEGKIDLNDFTLLENDVANQFYDNAKAGFPYQASVSIRPQVIEELAENVKGEVNGYSLKGPASIVRKAIYKESSVCVFGADSKTSVSAFSEDDMEETEVEVISFSEEEEKPKLKRRKTMDLKELKEQYSDILDEFKEEIKQELKASYDQTIQEKDTKISELEATVKSSETEKSELSQRVQSLEKNDLVRTEKEIQASAEAIVSKRLGETDWSQRFKDKVSSFISHEKYVDEKNVFDQTKFAEYVDNEVKEIEASLEEKKPKVKVDGISYSENHDGGDKEGLEAAAEAEADRLVGMVAPKTQQ